MDYSSYCARIVVYKHVVMFQLLDSIVSKNINAAAVVASSPGAKRHEYVVNRKIKIPTSESVRHQNACPVESVLSRLLYCVLNHCNKVYFILAPLILFLPAVNHLCLRICLKVGLDLEFYLRHQEITIPYQILSHRPSNPLSFTMNERGFDKA